MIQKKLVEQKLNEIGRFRIRILHNNVNVDILFNKNNFLNNLYLIILETNKIYWFNLENINSKYIDFRDKINGNFDGKVTWELKTQLKLDCKEENKNFWDKINRNIESANYKQNNYNWKDYKISLNNEFGLYIDHIRNTRMSDTHLFYLKNIFNLDEEYLRWIQKHNYTIVTKNDELNSENEKVLKLIEKLRKKDKSLINFNQ